MGGRVRPGLRERETVHDPAGEGIAGACSGVRPPEGGGSRGIRGKLVGAGLPLGEWGGGGAPMPPTVGANFYSKF